MGLLRLSSLSLFQDFARVQFLCEACPDSPLQPVATSGFDLSVPPLFRYKLPCLPGIKEAFKKCPRNEGMWPWGAVWGDTPPWHRGLST